ncbi:MAG: hypothetical protein MI919_09635, partial [Holophagales bacterium]|nr:hypothetical protein [Holophagales bacterium]
TLVQVPHLAAAHLALGELYAGPLADPVRARKHLNAFVDRASPNDPRLPGARRLLAGTPASVPRASS